MRIKLKDIEAAQLIAAHSGIESLQNQANLLLQQRGLAQRIKKLQQRQQEVAKQIRKRAKAPDVPLNEWDLNGLDPIECEGTIEIPEKE